MTVKMREGAYYERRDGKVVGPVRATGNPVYPWGAASKTYTSRGGYLNSEKSPFDLIREVPNPNMKEREMLLTETVTTTRIKEVINRKGPGCVIVSVVPREKGSCQIVIGAEYESARRCVFFRDTLTELIAELTAVRDALEE